jgi:hypothetical protein
MKKIIVVVLALVVSFSMFGLLAGCGVGAGDVDRITTGTQESNGVKYTNYIVHFKDSVNWASLSQSDREKLAQIGFDEAQKKIAENQVFNYNVKGKTADGVDAFQFNGEFETLIIKVDGETVGEVPAKMPER